MEVNKHGVEDLQLKRGEEEGKRMNITAWEKSLDRESIEGKGTLPCRKVFNKPKEMYPTTHSHLIVARHAKECTELPTALAGLEIEGGKGRKTKNK